jgi:DNA-directed RNA polymerase I and III subunit RPAC2
LDALIAALANLDNVCETIEDKYLNSLIHDSFERWEEKS